MASALEDCLSDFLSAVFYTLLKSDPELFLENVAQKTEWLTYSLGCIGILVEWRAYMLHCGQAFRRWSALAALLWAMQYFLLGAWIAGFTMACTSLRTLLSVKFETGRHQFWGAFIFVLLFVTLTAVSWQGWVSLLPGFAVINTTLALFYLDNRWMRIMLLASSLAWICNDMVWQAWPPLIAETVAMVINLFTIRMLFSQRSVL